MRCAAQRVTRINGHHWAHWITNYAGAVAIFVITPSEAHLKLKYREIMFVHTTRRFRCQRFWILHVARPWYCRALRKISKRFGSGNIRLWATAVSRDLSFRWGISIIVTAPGFHAQIEPKYGIYHGLLPFRVMISVWTGAINIIDSVARKFCSTKSIMDNQLRYSVFYGV